jgi:hypothetical protein
MEAERRWRYSSVDREFCMGDGGKDKTWEHEAEESPLLEAVAWKRLLDTLQAEEDLACSDL